MSEFKVGDRVKVPPSNWRPSTLGTVVELPEFCATGPVYVKRDDSGFTVGYRRDAIRHAPPELDAPAAVDGGAA